MVAARRDRAAPRDVCSRRRPRPRPCDRDCVESDAFDAALPRGAETPPGGRRRRRKGEGAFSSPLRAPPKELAEAIARYGKSRLLRFDSRYHALAECLRLLEVGHRNVM
jgi:hypothetical protein